MLLGHSLEDPESVLGPKHTESVFKKRDASKCIVSYGTARIACAPFLRHATRHVTLGPGRLRTQLRFLGAGQNSLVILRMFCPPHFAKAFLKRLPF